MCNIFKFIPSNKIFNFPFHFDKQDWGCTLPYQWNTLILKQLAMEFANFFLTWLVRLCAWSKIRLLAQRKWPKIYPKLRKRNHPLLPASMCALLDWHTFCLLPWLQPTLKYLIEIKKVIPCKITINLWSKSLKPLNK